MRIVRQLHFTFTLRLILTESSVPSLRLSESEDPRVHTVPVPFGSSSTGPPPFWFLPPQGLYALQDLRFPSLVKGSLPLTVLSSGRLSYGNWKRSRLNHGAVPSVNPLLTPHLSMLLVTSVGRCLTPTSLFTDRLLHPVPSSGRRQTKILPVQVIQV